jgi:energy-coupling factor transporter ATP-binding protein EcfA2
MLVFILGRTGSGKSTTARFLQEVARRSGLFVQSFNDYSFLREMFETDTTRRFCATEHNGFEVIDRSVFQIAICSLAQQVQSYYSTDDQTLITVEFTSNNYRDDLQYFDSQLLQDAQFLFLSVDLSTCLERTCKRVLYRTTEDDYYVKDTVLLRHYPCPYMPLCIGERKAQYIQNTGSLDDLYHRLHTLVPTLLEQQDRSKNLSLQKGHSALLVRAY